MYTHIGCQWHSSTGSFTSCFGRSCDKQSKKTVPLPNRFGTSRYSRSGAVSPGEAAARWQLPPLCFALSQAYPRVGRAHGQPAAADGCEHGEEMARRDQRRREWRRDQGSPTTDRGDTEEQEVAGGGAGGGPQRRGAGGGLGGPTQSSETRAVGGTGEVAGRRTGGGGGGPAGRWRTGEGGGPCVRCEWGMGAGAGVEGDKDKVRERK